MTVHTYSIDLKNIVLSSCATVEGRLNCFQLKETSPPGNMRLRDLLVVEARTFTFSAESAAVRDTWHQKIDKELRAQPESGPIVTVKDYKQKAMGGLANIREKLGNHMAARPVGEGGNQSPVQARSSVAQTPVSPKPAAPKSPAAMPTQQVASVTPSGDKKTYDVRIPVPATQQVHAAAPSSGTTDDGMLTIKAKKGQKVVITTSSAPPVSPAPVDRPDNPWRVAGNDEGEQKNDVRPGDRFNAAQRNPRSGTEDAPTVQKTAAERARERKALATSRVLEWQKSRDGWLNLSNISLTELADDLWTCQGLVNGLNLSRNQLASVPEQIVVFDKLRALWLADNKLRTLPPALGQLTCLKDLDLSRNFLKGLPATITSLTKLQRLVCSGNSIEHLPDSLDALVSLRQLALSDNHAPMLTLPTSFLELPSFVNVRMQGTVARIKPKEGEFAEIPDTLCVGSELQAGISLSELADYLQGGDLELPRQFRSMVVGDGEAGKTTLVEALTGAGAVTNATRRVRDAVGKRHVTFGLDVKSWEVHVNLSEDENSPEAPTTLAEGRIWDFAGQEMFQTMHTLFLRTDALFLLVFNCRKALHGYRGSTTDEMTNAIRLLDDWISLIAGRAPGAKVVLVGTHTDCAKFKDAKARERLDRELNHLIQRTSMREKDSTVQIVGSKAYFVNALKRGDDVQELIDVCSETVQGILRGRPKVPSRYRVAAEGIRKLRKGAGVPIMSLVDFDQAVRKQIGAMGGTVMPPARLAGLFRGWGLVEFFEDGPRSLRDMVILDPQWLAKQLAAVAVHSPNYQIVSGSESVPSQQLTLRGQRNSVDDGEEYRQDSAESEAIQVPDSDEVIHSGTLHVKQEGKRSGKDRWCRLVGGILVLYAPNDKTRKAIGSIPIRDRVCYVIPESGKRPVIAVRDGMTTWQLRTRDEASSQVWSGAIESAGAVWEIREKVDPTTRRASGRAGRTATQAQKLHDGKVTMAQLIEAWQQHGSQNSQETCSILVDVMVRRACTVISLWQLTHRAFRFLPRSRPTFFMSFPPAKFATSFPESLYFLRCYQSRRSWSYPSPLRPKNCGKALPRQNNSVNDCFPSQCYRRRFYPDCSCASIGCRHLGSMPGAKVSTWTRTSEHRAEQLSEA
jgi:GTPase SAR1 family protein